jgi:hypothetical protein
MGDSAVAGEDKVDKKMRLERTFDPTARRGESIRNAAKGIISRFEPHEKCLLLLRMTVVVAALRFGVLHLIQHHSQEVLIPKF